MRVRARVTVSVRLRVRVGVRVGMSMSVRVTVRVRVERWIANRGDSVILFSIIAIYSSLFYIILFHFIFILFTLQFSDFILLSQFYFYHIGVVFEQQKIKKQKKKKRKKRP